jgi:hypothetical protein
MERPAQPDRYEPLPPLLQIPGHLVRRLSPRARRIAVLALAAFTVAVVVGVPSLIAAKHRSDAAAARASARAQAARIAELRAEVRRVDGRGPAARGLSGPAALAARRALVSDLSGAITADAARRAATGEFAKPARRIECSRFPAGVGAPDPAEVLSRRSGRYACLAVTAEFAPGEASVGGALGYPYRALLHFGSGRFTFCKVSGRPGEMSITSTIPVPVPPACGGS